MEFIQSQFSIKDLENLSGIKAHTIRIWEKRYNLLRPERTDTNIRLYSAESLQKILNISLLNKNGLKISKIASLTHEEILERCRTLIEDQAVKDQALNNLKISMLQFDALKFNNTYNELSNQHDFKTIFNNFFIPFLDELGLLWQTQTISPAHEHFISALIKQKVLTEIEKLQYRSPKHTKTRFVLFLPDQEIHDLGLLYAYYILLEKGFMAIYLGQSIPVEDLYIFDNESHKNTFITYFTVKPSNEKINNYVTNVCEKLVDKNDSRLWVMGRKVTDITVDKEDTCLDKIISINDFTSRLEALIKQKAAS